MYEIKGIGEKYAFEIHNVIDEHQKLFKEVFPNFPSEEEIKGDEMPHTALVGQLIFITIFLGTIAYLVLKLVNAN